MVKAYVNIFKEFLRGGERTLRILPISGGIFAGGLQNETPWCSAVAIAKAYKRVPRGAKREIANFRAIQVCIYQENEFETDQRRRIG